MYEPLNLKTGDVFEASHVSHIEDGIVDCEDQCAELKDSLTEFPPLTYKGYLSEGFDDLITQETNGIYYINAVPVTGTTNQYGFLISLTIDMTAQIFLSNSGFFYRWRSGYPATWNGWRSITYTTVSTTSTTSEDITN